MGAKEEVVEVPVQDKFAGNRVGWKALTDWREEARTGDGYLLMASKKKPDLTVVESPIFSWAVSPPAGKQTYTGEVELAVDACASSVLPLLTMGLLLAKEKAESVLLALQRLEYCKEGAKTLCITWTINALTDAKSAHVDGYDLLVSKKMGAKPKTVCFDWVVMGRDKDGEGKTCCTGEVVVSLGSGTVALNAHLVEGAKKAMACAEYVLRALLTGPMAGSTT